MINSAHAYKISDIFSPDLNVKFVIPKFQREYVWRKEQVDYLFNDILENESGYFLGTIICIDKKTDALGISPLEVIDGQQRLTTISLLYAAIYSRLLAEQRSDEEFITEKINLKHRLILKKSKNETRLELSYQNNNFDDYKAILNELGLYEQPGFTRPPNLGNRRIYKIYQFLKGKIEEYDYKEILGILEKLNAALIVKIEVQNHADAFTLFESLNNRGVPLSATDLIKNKLLSVVDKKRIMDVDEAFINWTKIVGYVPDYSLQERFLRQYYNAFRYKPEVKVQGISRAIRSTLIKIYDQLIDRNSEWILKELVEKAKIYGEFVHPDTVEDNKKRKGLLDLLHVGAAPCYAFLLYLYSGHKEKKSLIEKTINFLVKYFVRRNLTDFPPTRELDQIFITLIDKCEERKDSLSFEFIKNFLTDPSRFSDLDRFREKLQGDIYEENAAVTRFILCKLEENHMTVEKYVDLWEKDKSGHYIWTIEHILPEGKNLPYEWVEMIANGDRKKAKDLQEQWVHKLGNLTLTGYNPNLSNFPFLKKRDRVNEKGNFIGYKNGLYLNSWLAQKERWTIEDIARRTDMLVEETIKLFKIEN